MAERSLVALNEMKKKQSSQRYHRHCTAMKRVSLYEFNGRLPLQPRKKTQKGKGNRTKTPQTLQLTERRCYCSRIAGKNLKCNRYSLFTKLYPEHMKFKIKKNFFSILFVFLFKITRTNVLFFGQKCFLMKLPWPWIGLTYRPLRPSFGDRYCAETPTTVHPAFPPPDLSWVMHFECPSAVRTLCPSSRHTPR